MARGCCEGRRSSRGSEGRSRGKACTSSLFVIGAASRWLIAHLVLIAVLASQVAKRWLARNDAAPLPHES